MYNYHSTHISAFTILYCSENEIIVVERSISQREITEFTNKFLMKVISTFFCKSVHDFFHKFMLNFKCSHIEKSEKRYVLTQSQPPPPPFNMFNSSI